MATTIIKNTSARVKETNMEIIRNTLKAEGPLSRTELSHITRLSISTCKNLIRELTESGEIIEDGVDTESGGRPAQKYSYNRNFSYALAMGIHMNDDIITVHHAVVNTFGEIISEKAGTYGEIDLNSIDAIIAGLIEEYPAINSIGIGFPGISDIDGNALFNDIQSLNGKPVVSHINEKFGLPVRIATSSDLIAYGYYKSRPELFGKIVIALLIPENRLLGAGIILNDKIFKGDTNTAGEVGYMKQNIASECCKSPEKCIDEISDFVMSLITCIGPSAVLLSGQGLSTDVFDAVCRRCRELLPDIFQPEFELDNNVDEYYLKGVINLTLDNLSSGVQLIKK